MSPKIPKNPFLFGVYASGPYKRWAVGALTSVFVATGMERFIVIILRNLTDSLSQPHPDLNSIWLWGISYPVVHFMSQNVWRLGGFTGMRWFMGLRDVGYRYLYEYLSLHSKDYFNSRFAGALANKISNAVEGTERLYEKILWRFIPLLIGLVWYTIFVSFSDLRLGIILFFWALVFLATNYFLAKRMQKYSFKFAQSLSTLKGKLVDSLSNISLVHEYAYVEGERNYIKKYVSKQTDAGLRHWVFSEWVLALNGFLIFVFMTLMFGTSIYLFQNQLISIGVVIMVIAIVGDLSGQFFFIGQEIKESARNYGEAREGLEEILSEHLVVDQAGAEELKFSKGFISVEKIDFSYEDSKIFEDLSLEIPAGQKVGFVGRSGAGKSTFVSLLLRHFDVQEGAIKIDGQNIKDITLESLRRIIAFVPQDTSMFHRTIRENISYSNNEATEKEIVEAAKAAQAHDFVQNLPDKYETLVGERGVKLSGGQRQRIAIARAFLKNAPILLLDEATSSLDSESEHAIQESLERLMEGRTVIAIAHRLSTLKKMDRIVIFEDGKIAEDGRPEELLKKNKGIFKGMWEHQVKGFIVD